MSIKTLLNILKKNNFRIINNALVLKDFRYVIVVFQYI